MDAFLQTIAGIAMAIATAFIPIVVRLVQRKLNLDEDNALRANLETALNAAAGAAYIAAMKGMSQEAAVQQGVRYLSTRMPDTMTKLDLPATRIAPMIEARMGSLFASDPTVQGPQQ